MLKALYLLLMSFALAAMATAQNLVPNPSFEDTVNCEVQTQCMLLKAEHWRNPNLATPDVFDCDLDRICGYAMDPDNINNPPGYFHSAHAGLRFAGGMLWWGPGTSPTRDYLMARLTQPMEQGRTYEIALWYLLPSTFQYGLDHIGAWLGPDSLFSATPNWLTAVPQISLFGAGDYLSEDGWTRISDTIIASGTEQWIVIGNFDPEGSENGALLNPDGLQNSSFYFIDDVSVEEIESSGIEVPFVGASIQAGRLRIGISGGTLVRSVRILDVRGRLISTVDVQPAMTSIDIDLPYLADGLYLAELTSSGFTFCTKFIKGRE